MMQPHLWQHIVFGSCEFFKEIAKCIIGNLYYYIALLVNGQTMRDSEGLAQK